MAALPFDHTPSGAATLTLSASDLSGEEGTERLLALLESYFRLGGLHLQVNVLDGKTLEEARQNPERYPDLMVRVTGFSAYFTRLSRNVQEDLIRRYRRDGPGG
jgi:formate C-acetyltransferase